MRFFLIPAVVFFVSGCASLFSQPNKTQVSTPAAFQGSSVTMRTKLEPLEPGPTATAIASDKLFAIDPKDRSISDALGRWAQQNKLLFGWLANYDYPLTPPMRAISAPNFDAALNSIRIALRSVAKPLLISVSGQTLTVRPGEARITGASPISLAASVATPAVSHGKQDEVVPVVTQKDVVTALQWVINPTDLLLSESLVRWSALANVKITWSASIDYPVTIKKPREYSGSFSEAVNAVLKEAAKGGVPLTHVLVGNELIIKESGT